MLIGKLSKQDAGNAYLYLVLSFLSGVLETGVVTAWVTRFGLAMALAFALAYQIGCLARNPLRLSLRGATCLLFCSLALLLFNGSTWIMLLVVALVSGGIQSAREWSSPKQEPIPVSTKRMVRLSGFVCGILAGFTLGTVLVAFLAIVASLAVLSASLRHTEPTPWIRLNMRWMSDGFGWTMLLHQVHYFAYAYVLLALLLTPCGKNGIGFSLWQPIAASVWFALGWFSYISGKWLLRDVLRMPASRAGIYGHAWVSICLVCMAVSHRNPLILGGAWILGGFGGGCVYAIKELAKSQGCRADIELWEHWGHVVGVSLSLGIILLFPHYLSAPFLAALASALATLILLWRSTVSQTV